MKTKEKIDYAVSRIKELFLLINSWTRGVSDKTSEYYDIKKRKQQLIEDLYTNNKHIVKPDRELPRPHNKQLIKRENSIIIDNQIPRRCNNTWIT